jgi:hypothetical protein
MAIETPSRAVSTPESSRLSDAEDTAEEQKSDDNEEAAPASDEDHRDGDSSYAATSGYNEIIEDAELAGM